MRAHISNIWNHWDREGDPVNLTRRRFLKLTGLAAAGVALEARPLAGQDGSLSSGAPPAPPIGEDTLRTHTICPFCAVGCGLICHTDRQTGRVVYTEGDGEHPINEGALCAKGAAVTQIACNDNRVTKVLYRAPGAGAWEEKSWDWALGEIARRVKSSRDTGFRLVNARGQRVNRCENIASVGSAALDNEECWVYQAMLRALGLVYIEHQARI